MSHPPSGERAALRASTINSSGTQRPRRLSGFVEWVLEESTHKRELNAWFTKPTKEDITQPLPQTSPTYAQVPEELRRHNLLKSAERYYEHPDHRRRPSTWLVRLFTVVFFIPALLVFFISRVGHTVFPPKPSATPSPAQPVIRPISEGENKEASSSQSPALHEFDAASPPPKRHAYDFDGPWSFARSWALYVVYIPMTRYHGTGGFKGALLPSQSPKFLNDHAAALAKGKQPEDDAFHELQRAKKLYKTVVKQRRAALVKVEGALEGPEESSSELDGALKAYENKLKTAVRLKAAVDDAQKEWEWVREVAKTETCAQATNYRGIADWATDAYGSYSNLMNAISGVCFVGAGLTYSSIFGAVRGNLGLMCWSFSLFIVGLSILITVQSLLVWCSRLDNYPFSTPKLWEFFLGVGVYGACASVVTAILLLVVTVLGLEFNVTAGTIYNNPNSSPWDAHLIFNVTPRYAAIVAFAFIGAGVVVAVLVFVLFSMANTVKLFLWRRGIERSRKHRVRLDDLV